MGNHRFRLSDMIPNAWFYKLRDMGTSRKKASSSQSLTKPASVGSSSQQPPSRAIDSYYVANPAVQEDQFCKKGRTMNTQLPDHPRKTVYRPSSGIVSHPSAENDSSSNGQANSSRARYSSTPTYSPDRSCSCSSDGSMPPWFEEENDLFTGDHCADHIAYMGRSCSCEVGSLNSERIIDMDEASLGRHPHKFTCFSSVELPRILTKPHATCSKKADTEGKLRGASSEYEEVRRLRPPSAKLVKEKSAMAPRREKKSVAAPRKSLSNSSGIRLRTSATRIVTRRLRHEIRKSLSSSSVDGPFPESFAIVKSSVDPQEDFKRSMIEMILENNIRKSKDLEELLVCYLSLNSYEYHDSIVKAFEQTCLNLARLRL